MYMLDWLDEVVCVCVYACIRVCVYARSCVRACVCVRACARVRVWAYAYLDMKAKMGSCV